MQTSANVTASKPKVEGACWRAPVGTALPKDATSPLNEAFKSLGYISEDGLTNTLSKETEKTKAWGGDVVNVQQTGLEVGYKVTLIEGLNDEVLKAAHGDSNVTGTLSTGLEVKINSELQKAASWVFEMVLKEGAIKRIVVPSAKVDSIGDIVYNGKDPVGYELNLIAETDTEGQAAYEYIKKGA